jgi:predicted secreted protein
VEGDGFLEIGMHEAPIVLENEAMTIQRLTMGLLVMAGLSVVTACSREPAASDKPAAAPAITFKPVEPGAAAPTGPLFPTVGAPGGPSAMVTDMASGWPITLQVGQDVMVRLATDRTGGMAWKPRAASDVLAAGEPAFEPGPAGGGTEVYRVKALKPGEATLVFEYRRTADPNAAPARTVSYQVTVK